MRKRARRCDLTASQFVKFGIVGASGTVVNFIVAHALEKTTTLSWFADFAIGFMVGGVSNYILNRIWTFGSRRNPFVEGLQFLAVSAIALLVGNVVFTIAGTYGLPSLYDDVVRRDALRHLRQLFSE